MMNPGGFTADFPEDDGWGGGERPTRRGKGKPAAAAARRGRRSPMREDAPVQVLSPGCLGVLVAALLAGGCATATALPPVDLSKPGWDVRETPALWCAQRGAPELAGELMVAVNGTDRVVQFSKQGLPVVTAVVMSNRWQVTSALRPGTHGGRLPAPARLPWFIVDGSPPHRPIPPWQLAVREAPSGWTLSNPRTGEWIDVVEP